MNIFFNCDREKSHSYGVSGASILSVNVEILGLKPGFVDIEFLSLLFPSPAVEGAVNPILPSGYQYSPVDVNNILVFKKGNI
jgi:hypothetical protein